MAADAAEEEEEEESHNVCLRAFRLLSLSKMSSMKKEFLAILCLCVFLCVCFSTELFVCVLESFFSLLQMENKCELVKIHIKIYFY